MKKKILWLSNFSLANSGFGKATKEILSRLYKTKKYELCELSAGISDNNPEVTRLPWKVIGILPRTPEELHRFNSVDEGTKRAFSYGLFRFDEAVDTFKPDIIVGFEDIWCWSGWLKNSKYYGKFIPIAWHPLDAEPLSEEFTNFLKDIPHVYTYSKWSQQIGHDAGLKNVKVFPLGVDPNVFRPLDKNFISNTRFKWGLQDTDFVVLMVARNQVRKKFDALFESLNDLKKLNPNLYSRVKILPFTHYSDGAGFDFTKLWKSRNIDVSKILTPYICRTCRQYHISHKFLGEDAPCPHCKTQPSKDPANPVACQTPYVNYGFTEEQLNEVYNICDVKVLATSNEGFGIPLCEALAAGKSIITTGYLTGAEIAENSKAGLLIPYSVYTEYGTLFKKANITSADIAKKINEYYLLPKEKKEQMSKNARKCILDVYNYDVIARDFEKELDAIQPLQNVDWVIPAPKIKHPNPNAEIPPCQNDMEWLLALYKLVLDTDILEETKGQPLMNDGIKYWLNAITNGQDKKQIESIFKGIATEDVKKKTVDLMSFLDPSDEKRMLFAMKESAGDNFLCTAIVASLKEKYPNHSIYISCRPEFFEIWKSNPHIKGLIPWMDYMMTYSWGLSRFEKGPFDIVFTPGMLTQVAPASWHNNGNTKSFLL